MLHLLYMKTINLRNDLKKTLFMREIRNTLLNYGG